MGSVAPDVAAQAQKRREMTANLGPWREFVLALAKELPRDSGVRPVQEVLMYLQRGNDYSPTARTLESLKQEVTKVCDLNDAEAIVWKERGNKAYESGKLEESLLMYTRGMMYASRDDTLATIMNNRSTVFFAQMRFFEALADAHAAFMLIPQYWKALRRRGVCLQKLGIEQCGAKDIEAATHTNTELANPVEVVAEILRCGNDKNGGETVVERGVATISPAVPISYGVGVNGVVAKNRVEPGDVMAETPIAYALYDDHWGVRCSCCLRVTRLLYPGTAYRSRGKVSRGLFCGEECANISWEWYGQFETLNPFFQLCPVDALIASRMLRSGQIPQGHSPSLRCDFTGELYPAAVVGGYETVVSVIALFLGAVSPQDSDSFRVAQRQVILSGFEIKFLTPSQLTAKNEEGEIFIDEPRTILVGKAVYLAASHFRHSCDPNCFASFVGNPSDCSLRLAVRAIRPVLVGEELSIAYHNMTTHKAFSAHTRRRALAERFGFLCKCFACLHNKDECVSVEKKAYYVQAGDLYQKGCRLFREGQYDVAVHVLMQSYAITMEQLCPPPRPPQSMLPKVHMALAKAFNRLKKNEECLGHLVVKTELDHVLCEGDHVEFVDDFIRLAFLELTEKRRRMFAERAVELLCRFYPSSSALDGQIKRVESLVEQGSS